MDLKTHDSQQPNGFNLADFAAREQRRTQRLVRAAYGVGHTHPWFVALSRADQEKKVREWVDEALDARAERLWLMSC
ncbi:hypothetical protein [Hydrogenophaga sp. MI9]|uniref:hypothetical protein n=1 Tax=Hydrogenophaga sp. MI9 TaxID=3453719 RepID=UPI003EEE0540